MKKKQDDILQGKPVLTHLPYDFTNSFSENTGNTRVLRDKNETVCVTFDCIYGRGEFTKTLYKERFR